MRRYIPRDADNTLETDPNRKRDLTNWINVVSQQIAQFLNRQLLLGSYVEYFDVEYNHARFACNAVPITSITSIYEDPSGLFGTSTKALITDTEYFIGDDTGHFCLYRALPYTARHSLQITYVGGLAASAANTVLAITSPSGAFTVGNYVLGATSAAIGILRAYSATSITVEMLQGIFDSAESLEEHAQEHCSDTALHTATLASVTTASLADTYPAIVRAAEIQVRWNWQRKTEFGLTTSARDGQVVVNSAKREGGHTQLIEEVESMLVPYKRYMLA